ncbi:FAD/NAD(P)-binding protein [Streptomyces sp. NPDC001941]|uniref:FAD/NAD(P)-binding protein n=1 Tax=Streptomyces sp. NPDC001941 TaxID=3154659 RepID=UPI0033331E23
MSQRPSLAVIGAGAAAVCLLNELTRRDLPTASLTVFDPSSLLWRGRAYQPDADCARTNAVPGGMSVRHENPRDFLQWLDVRDLFTEERDPVHGGLRYPPRPVYGEYLQACAFDALDTLMRRGWDVRVHREQVTHAASEDDGILLRTSTARTELFDQVVLAVGGDRPQDAYKLSGRRDFTHDPYPLRKTLAPLSATAHVGILGCGLTAIDVVVALREQGHRGPISMVSRTGTLPGVRPYPVEGLPQLPSGWNDLPDSGDEGLRWSRAAAWVGDLLTAAGTDPADLAREFRTAASEPPVRRLQRHLEGAAEPLSALRLLQGVAPYLGPRLWSRLREDDRAQLLRAHQRTIMSLCCPMSPRSANTLLGLAAQGGLRLHRGLAGVTPGTRGGHALDTADGTRVTVDHLVNACGRAPDCVPRAAHPLVNSLISGGLAVPHPHGGLRADPRTDQLLTPHGPDPRLYALGDITLGTFLFTFGIPALVARAHELAAALEHQLAMSPA